MNTKKNVFEGCATALITPFKDDKIDFKALEELIDFQLESGVKAIVVLGTTGESPTIEEKERDEIIDLAKKKMEGKATLIVGVGSNSTKRTIKFTQGAQKRGADAVLCVTPYYNKATPRGLAMHYTEVAKSTDLPVILYNVPSRTGLKISIETLGMLRDVENIVAIKEATTDVSEIERKISIFKDDFYFYSGCDELILPIYSLGGIGVISAVANAIPREICTLCQLFEKRENERAAELALKISPIIKELFAEVNPIPVKGLLSLMGRCKNELRLPLCESSRMEELQKIKEMLPVL